MFCLDKFISENITKHPVSMFLEDVKNNKDILGKKIADKSILVIGGAGSIGSSFIKAILPFKPESLVIVYQKFEIKIEIICSIRAAPSWVFSTGFIWM